MKEATPRQLEVLAFIRGHIEDTGYPPSRREIADHFGFATVGAAVQDHLRALERKGLIVRDHGSSRAIRIVAPMRRIWFASGLPHLHITRDEITHWIPATHQETT